MDGEIRDTPPPRIERFFEALLARDGAGGSWLGPLLRAAPRGRARFGELAERPGWIEAPVAVITETGRRGAFEYPAAPARELLGWFIDHPLRLSRPAGESARPETRRLRRALLDDDPPGARARAQDRAHELLRRTAPFGEAWWRFEQAHTADCLLMTDRLVVLVQDGDGRAPATPWFPQRTTLVRDLEAARRFGEGRRAWGVLVLGGEGGAEDGTADGGDGGADRGADGGADGGVDAQALARELQDGAPHLDAEGRRELAAGYLGVLSWSRAAAATGLEAAVL